MSDLRECPFCNSNLEQDQYSTCEATDEYAVYCHGCEANGPFAESIDRAKEEWNTRHIPEGYALVPIGLLEAVAYTGVDFGFGKYELEDKHIKMARDLLEAVKE